MQTFAKLGQKRHKMKQTQSTPFPYHPVATNANAHMPLFFVILLVAVFCLVSFWLSFVKPLVSAPDN